MQQHIITAFGTRYQKFKSICCYYYYYTRLTVSFPGQPGQGKASLDLNEARDDVVLGWQWHQLDHMQTICTLLKTDNHTNTSSLKFLQAGCSSRHPSDSVKALKPSASK